MPHLCVIALIDSTWSFLKHHPFAVQCCPSLRRQDVIRIGPRLLPRPPSANMIPSVSFWAFFATTLSVASASTTARPLPIAQGQHSLLLESDGLNRNVTSTTTTSIGHLLPRVSQWPHRPVFLQAGTNTEILHQSPHQALPLGVPFEFETPLFKGKLLVRFRNVKSDDKASHDAYFDGNNRVMQAVVQGRFKKPVSMANVYAGSIFKEPLSLVPPPLFMRMLKVLFHRMSPGAILDFASRQPKVVSLYAGAAQTLSIDLPGQEPDMTAPQLPECVPGRRNDHITGYERIDRVFESVAERKRKLSKPEKAARYNFDTDHVYTMEIHDDFMDYGAHNIKLPVYGHFNLIQAIGPQPMSLSAVTAQGEVMYDFIVWHESVYRRKFRDEA
jgi:Protein of unknown function (DUF1769)